MNTSSEIWRVCGWKAVYKEYFVKREEEKQRRRKLSFKSELTGLKIIQPYEGLSRVP